MHQSLALKHQDVSNSRQVRILLDTFLYGNGLVSLNLLGNDVLSQLSDIVGSL